MDANQKALLAEAVNTLIQDTDAADLYKKLNWVYDVAKKNVPVQLSGRASVLNPLLELMMTDNPAAERVVQLIERKRDEAGLDPLDENNVDRKGYMRELMATKRDRQRRLVELVNQLRSEHDKIKGSARMEFERVHAARWFDVRSERELALRDKLGRRLSLEERQSVIQKLWEDVDVELADLEDFVRTEVRKPLTQRAPNGFNFKLQPKKGNP